MIDVLFTLTSFETFDTLAGSAKTPEAVTPLVQHLSRAAIGLPAGRPASARRRRIGAG